VATAALVLLTAAASASAPIRGHTEVPDLAAAQMRAPLALAFFGERRGLLVRVDGTLLATRNGGGSWWRAGRLAIEHLEALSPTVAYATTKRALLRTDDRGGHWRLVARVAGAISFADALHGWIEGRRALATDDGARTLRPLHTPCRASPGEFVALSRVSVTLGFAACAGDPGAGSQLKRLYVTRDGGRTWQLRAGERQVPAAGYLASLSFADARDGLMTTGRGGLLATRDGGRSWRMLLLTDDATDVVAAQRLGAQELVALLQNGALLRSHDDGAHWLLVYPHTLPAPAQLSFSTTRDGIGAGYTGWTFTEPAILVTHDGGRSWKLREPLPADLSASSLVRASPSLVYLVASSYRRVGSVLLRSSDDGRSWRRLRTPPAARFFAVSFTSASEGVLADDAGRFYTTHDSGASWTLVHTRGEDLRTFAFLTTTRGLALATPPLSTTLYETRDGGRSWHVYTRAPVQRPLAFTTLGANRVWIVDMPICSPAATRRRPNCPGALVRTADGGRTWQRIELNMIPATTLDFPTATVGYAQDSGLGTFRTRDGGHDWVLVR